MSVRPDALDESRRLCEEITRTEARNFYYGLRLLPGPERAALYAVYAWMRVLDDIADETGAPEGERAARLDRFARATVAAFEGRREVGEGPRERAVLVAVADVRGRHGVDVGDFLAAIEGQRMDLAPRVYASFDDTRTYCDRVASTVGRICLDVWGVRHGADAGRARELSTSRGIAFQLTNVLRDLREDHARGRCYLPQDELAAHGLSVDDLVQWRSGDRCAAFMRAQCARASGYFDASAPLEGLVSVAAVPTLSAMSVIYRRILGRIARDPRAALARRVSLSRLEKVSIGLRARLGLLPAGGGGR